MLLRIPISIQGDIADVGYLLQIGLLEPSELPNVEAARLEYAPLC